MKNWLKTLLIIAILMASFSYGFKALAQISVYDIEIVDMKNGQATVKWRTNENTKSIVYYGSTADNLDKKSSNNTYKRSHQAILYNLEEDKTYYYKIELRAYDGEKLEVYTRSFSTNDMIDTVAPKFLESNVVQTIGNTVALSWKANEKVYTEIHYWKKDTNENKIIVGVGGYAEYNETFVYNLDSYSQYYVKIVIKDSSGNKESKTFSVNVYEKFDINSELKLRNIEPLNSNNNLISSNRVTIKFNSNLAARSYIQYGTSPDRLGSVAYINDQKITTDHQVTIKDLTANTTYYYNIYAYNAVYNKSILIQGLSFTTKANVLGVKASAANLDSDHDQLSNSYEITIGTNPSDPDTDNDGYRDGVEVQNGFNPLGPGKWHKKVDFVYGQVRLDTATENTKAQELKNIIKKKLKYLPIKSSLWPTLVDAYIYGDYPIEAILMYIKLEGKTINPDISWSNWQYSPEYIKYMK